MKKITTSAFIIFSVTVNAQCALRTLPFTESFSSNPFLVCTATTGGWSKTSAASGADWWMPSPPSNYAGGTAPEVEAYGDNANGGVSETIRLISPGIQTTGVSAATLSFKHNLYLTNSAASGSGLITVKAETSPDKTNWTQVYNAGYNATSSLNSVVNETRTLSLSNLTDSTFLRFSISGVLFKVYGWEIDDVNLSSNTTYIKENKESFLLSSNPVRENIIIRESGLISVYNLNGELLVKKEVTYNETVDLRNFANGIYFVQLQNSRGISTNKIIKE